MAPVTPSRGHGEPLVGPARLADDEEEVGELQTGYGELTLGEVARRAVAGDQDAEKGR